MKSASPTQDPSARRLHAAGKAGALALLLLFSLALVCPSPLAEGGIFPPSQGSLRPQDTVSAYYYYPSLKEAEETHAKTTALPSFDVSDGVVSQLFALQGVNAHFPAQPPLGYQRAPQVSLRKMKSGVITQEQRLFDAYFMESLPEIITNADGSVAYKYEVPVSLLSDITYAGTVYEDPGAGDKVMVLIRLYPPSELPFTIVPYPNYAILQKYEDGPKWEKAQSPSPDAKGSYYRLERTSGERIFLHGISTEAYEALRFGIAKGSAALARPVVMYELSSETADIQVLRAFLDNIMLEANP